jgi:hypothetical protein
MLAGLRFHLSRLLISSCVLPRSGGTETELADLGPPTGLPAHSTGRGVMVQLRTDLDGAARRRC